MRSNSLLHSKADYIAAIRKLFPLGVYWERQFDNPESDLSLWIGAKADELYRFKNRFTELIAESTPKTADSTLDEWERVLLGVISPDLPIELRRKLLLTKRRGFVNRDVLQGIASLYGAKIKRLFFPFRSAFCGHTRLAVNRICSPASFSVLFVNAEIKNQVQKNDFEREIRNSLLANMIIYFFYD